MMGTEHNKISSKYQQEYPFQSHKSSPSEIFFPSLPWQSFVSQPSFGFNSSTSHGWISLSFLVSSLFLSAGHYHSPMCLILMLFSWRNVACMLPNILPLSYLKSSATCFQWGCFCTSLYCYPKDISNPFDANKPRHTYPLSLVGA